MKNWFKWNDKLSTDFDVYVTELPEPTMPTERVTYVDVPGRNGSLSVLEGDTVYADLTLSATCIIKKPSRIPEVCAWLRGRGNVTFANRPDGYYEARVANQVSFEKIVRGSPTREFSVNFRCKPFWYHSNVEDITLEKSGEFVDNIGSVFSEPIITVNGSDDITLMIGANLIDLRGVDGKITLDSALLEIYKDNTSQNNKMAGEFPILQPGKTAISWTGNVSSVVVSGRWRSF